MQMLYKINYKTFLATLHTHSIVKQDTDNILRKKALLLSFFNILCIINEIYKVSILCYSLYFICNMWDGWLRKLPHPYGGIGDQYFLEFFMYS